MDCSSKLVALGLILSASVTQAAPAIFKPMVIYGEDNRLDLYQVNDRRVLALADSTVSMIPNDRLVMGDKTVKINTVPYQQRFGLCSTERFIEQSFAADCSGFLISPTRVVTAGHCVNNISECDGNKFVFGFALKSKTDTTPQSIPASQVYSCKNVVSFAYELGGLDYSVVELDRPVTDHAPLAVNTTGKIANNTKLFVIGNPAGLPTKIAGGAAVRSQDEISFLANLDTYGGNSGSAVFNQTTGQVEGILVRGETDFVTVQSGGNICRISNVCPDDGCRGETVTKAAILRDFLN